MHPAEQQRKILLVAKLVSAVIALAGFPSIVFMVGWTDVQGVSITAIMPQLTSQIVTIAIAGGIWTVTSYLENYRKK